MTRNRSSADGQSSVAPFLVALGLSAVFENAAFAQCEVDKFIGTGIHQQDQFAYSLAADGLTVVAGAYKADSKGGESGTVFVFEYDGYGWNETAVLSASDGAPFDHLGFDVDVVGQMAVAGAPDEGTGSNKPGAAYFYLHFPSAWLQYKKLVASDGAHGDRFGASVAVSDSFIFVGAPDKAGGGAVYVFEIQGGVVQVQKLTAPDAISGAQFGFDVACDGATLAIGSRRWDSPSAPGAGKVYLYGFDGVHWAFQESLTAFDGKQGDFFGSAVSVKGDHVLVGAPNDDDQGFNTNSNTGVGFYFARTVRGWNFVEKVKPPSTSHGFATSLEFDGNHLLVGAFLDKQIGMDAGAGHVFELVNGNFQHRYKITTSDHIAFDELGGAVALSGDLALISADFDDDAGWNAGAAYGFSVSERNCKPLYAWPDTVSLAAGGRQDWTLEAGGAYGGFVYWVLGSLSGTGGFPYQNTFVPLKPDPYFYLTLKTKNGPNFPNSLGLLHPDGSAGAAFQIPANMDPGLAGVELYHAFVLYDPVSLIAEYASNLTKVEFAP